MKVRTNDSATEEPLETYRLLLKTTTQVSRDIMRNLLPRHFTLAQYQVLEILYLKGPMYQRDVADFLMKQPSTTNVTIDKLEDRDLLKRIRRKGDRRYVQVEITTQGKKLVKRILPTQNKRIMETVGVLTKADQEHLKRICQNLARKENKISARF